jgi:hypothetical protein
LGALAEVFDEAEIFVEDFDLIGAAEGVEESAADGGEDGEPGDLFGVFAAFAGAGGVIDASGAVGADVEGLGEAVGSDEAGDVIGYAIGLAAGEDGDFGIGHGAGGADAGAGGIDLGVAGLELGMVFEGEGECRFEREGGSGARVGGDDQAQAADELRRNHSSGRLLRGGGNAVVALNKS